MRGQSAFFEGVLQAVGGWPDNAGTGRLSQKGNGFGFVAFGYFGHYFVNFLKGS
jgi:hypothetical protein